MSKELITILVSFRERWGLTLETVKSINRFTSLPHNVVVIDIGMPNELRQQLLEVKNLEIKSVDSTFPNIARGIVASEINSPYVLFIDNDVVVTEGWLEKLLDCAITNQAGIVAPLYMIGSNEHSDKIHMAGGSIFASYEPEGVSLTESHQYMNQSYVMNKTNLKAGSCDFAEFHCMLVKKEVLQLPDFFHPEISIVHEHIHASLVSRRHGFDTWFEPEAKVFYLAFTPFLVSDLKMFRWRWNLNDARRTLNAFANHWGIARDSGCFDNVENFLVEHLSEIDHIDPRFERLVEREKILTRENLGQTPAQFFFLACRRGYSPAEIELLWRALTIAMKISDGIYRPCGRPFLNHLIGTAYVLMYFGLSLRLILAGLLHSAFTHTASNMSSDSKISALLDNIGSSVRVLVSNYSIRNELYENIEGQSIEHLKTPILDILLIEAANEIDMHLSLEVGSAKRQDFLSADKLDLIKAACNNAGNPGIQQTLDSLSEYRNLEFSVKFYEGHGSFIFKNDRAVSAKR